MGKFGRPAAARLGNLASGFARPSLGPPHRRQNTSAKWDAAIDYQGLWKSAFLPFFGGVPKRIGFSSATIREFGVPILYTDQCTCQTTHIADQNGELPLRAGAQTTGGGAVIQSTDADAARVREDLSKEGFARYVVLSPGGGWRSKCWPADRFGALCQKIHEQIGVPCVVNYGPGEESLVAEVQATSGNSKPLPYDGEMGTAHGALTRCAMHRRRRHRASASGGCPRYSRRRAFRSDRSAAKWPVSPGKLVLRSPTLSQPTSALNRNRSFLTRTLRGRGVCSGKAALGACRDRARLLCAVACSPWIRLRGRRAVPRPANSTLDLIGAVIGFIGLCIRAYAAGYLHKQEVLTVTGPYARTRNPLYFGSSILTLGAAIAMHSGWAAAHAPGVFRAGLYLRHAPRR